MSSPINIFVLYHAKCQDGLGAKYAAHKRYLDTARYIPVTYGKPFPAEIPLTKQTEVYILDFSYDKATLERIHAQVGTLVVLDHHKTAEEELRGLTFVTFDMEKSGAVLAWEYFHPGIPAPRILNRIQDRDLWRFQYSDTKPVLASLTLAGENFGLWDYLDINYATTRTAGESIVKYQDDYVDRATDNREGAFFEANWTNKRVLVFNSTHLLPETASELLRKNPHFDFAIGFSFNREGAPVLSMRSRTESLEYFNPTLDPEDVSAICKYLGGGGHRNAAGAKIDMQLLEILVSRKIVLPPDLIAFNQRRLAPT